MLRVVLAFCALGLLYLSEPADARIDHSMPPSPIQQPDRMSRLVEINIIDLLAGMDIYNLGAFDGKKRQAMYRGLVTVATADLAEKPEHLLFAQSSIQQEATKPHYLGPQAVTTLLILSSAALLWLGISTRRMP